MARSFTQGCVARLCASARLEAEASSLPPLARRASGGYSGGMTFKPVPSPKAPGQESVWDYPRPAICEPTPRRIRIIHHGETLVDSVRAVRTLETSHPPSYYVPPQDIAEGLLWPGDRRSLCEWKGVARYFDVNLFGELIESAAWSYADPTPPFAPLAGFVAFYGQYFDLCMVDDEVAVLQEGGFYGGWITGDLAGPFKGVPGSRFW
jgi:uncharacterized protein (DUF427 family)